jgi:uncharacterized protein (DUF427 family)
METVPSPREDITATPPASTSPAVMPRRLRIEPNPGQESVWDYPRPPRLERSASHIVIRLDAQVAVDTVRSLRVLETSHPPVHYVDPGDVHVVLRRTFRRTWCEWKGEAAYWAVAGSDREVAWSYPAPARGFEALTDYVAFYPARVDHITLDGETVIAQSGDFYGGWVTSKVVGTFKGEPGTAGW